VTVRSSTSSGRERQGRNLQQRLGSGEFADGHPPAVDGAAALIHPGGQYLNLTIKPVSRPKDASGFVVLPRRWGVERSLAWIMRARRHARDYERLIQHSETLITWAAITLMPRRLARKGATPGWTRKPVPAEG
jgi:hypothetical protein